MIDPTRLALLSALFLGGALVGSDGDDSGRPDFARAREAGLRHSRYLGENVEPLEAGPRGPALEAFRAEIEPILTGACSACHGPEKQKAGVRIDALDPDLFAGEDVDWWLEVLGVLTNGEMPPEGEAELSDADRARVIEWLSGEVGAASSARRASREHSPFRRLTRYEYEYALQDLLGLPFAFADALPPDPSAPHGFENTSETLHVSPLQFEAYLEAGRAALELATVRGERPEELRWSLSMPALAATHFARQDRAVEELRAKHADDPAQLEAELAKQAAQFAQRPGGVHFEDEGSGRMVGQAWNYGGAAYAFAPTTEPAAPLESTETIAVVPRGSALIVELGDRVPDRGPLRVRVLAAPGDAAPERAPSLRLVFGWQASNDSRAAIPVGDGDTVVEGDPGAPRVYEWTVPLSQVHPRNSVRGINRLGDLPNPSEYLKLVNSSLSGGALHVHHVEVVAPAYERWPTASHERVLGVRADTEDERTYATRAVADFLSRAWRRAPTPDELDRKLALLDRIRPRVDTLEDALLEVFATALASPNFLYVAASAPDGEAEAESAPLGPRELATRLSLFLWCSTPDDELLALAREGRLAEPEVLRGQVARMLADPRSRRFSQHFVRQWLGLALLDHLHVDEETYPEFEEDLKRAMHEEPVALFDEVLRGDHSVLEFLHSDFTLVNERLARHYGLEGVVGNEFRRVELDALPERGGLLTLPGLLAMNSDGKDSHPLKRGIWMLERLLDDPPPPPPPAVPIIDLADPEIAKLTLKERLEDHRNDPACLSCHAKIDPWGIAFENFDAVGSWRTEVNGRPVDANSVLFNGQALDGMDGLKRFLLEHRQDQFVRALAHKLATYALGRPLGFSDRAALEGITRETRRGGDGLATMIEEIVTSDLFQMR